MDREHRRQKQRESNPARAQKMHLARMESGSLPFISNPPPLNIGCSGWFYWDWRKVFYPEDLPTKDWFPYYARHFDTVELNAPFYTWPTVTTVRSWLRQVKQEKFVYTVKVSELITHVKRFCGTKELVRDFGYIADLLGERMGCFLFQLPPGFYYTPARLKHIVEQLDPARRNVVEFRHKSWWNDKVYKAFHKAGIIFCSCSAPQLPDELIKTTDEIYIRFHGPENWYRHDYSMEELAVWARRVRKSGAKRVWVYFNNDYHGYAIKNAHMLMSLLNPSGKEALVPQQNKELSLWSKQTKNLPSLPALPVALDINSLSSSRRTDST